jgi:uncharacterized membrane protein YeaQ/YmgE (transglycosylase-associated protein family)
VEDFFSSSSRSIDPFSTARLGKEDAMNFLWFLLIGLAAGWLAGVIMKGGGFGVIGDLVVGVIGAIVGGSLFDALGIASYGLLGALITATVGAIVLIALLRVLGRASRSPT